MATEKNAEEKEIKEETTEEVTPEVTETEPENEFEKKYNDVNEKYMRTLAEYDNYRKRTIKEKESIYPEAKAVVIEKFLPVMDNFQRAIDSAENKDGFYEGVVMLKKHLKTKFQYHCNGKMGQLTRLINPMLGSYLIFTIAEYKDTSAYEQINLEKMVDLFRYLDM